MIFGGCEGNKLAMGIAAVVLVITIIMVFYIWTFANDKKFLSEGFASGNGTCGGNDALCSCSGNETFTGMKTDGELSKQMVGL